MAGQILDAETVPRPTKSFSGLQSCALAVVSALAWFSFSALPYEVSTLAGRAHMGSLGAGIIASAELVALAVMATLVGRTIPSRDKRLLSLAGIVVAAAASGVSVLMQGFAALLAVRLIFGGALGVLAAATNALPASHQQPTRMFAYMQVGLAIVFSGSIYAIAWATAAYEADGLFLVEAVIILAVGSLALFLPEGRSIVAGDEVEARRGVLPAGNRPALAGLFLMFLGQSALWAFAEQAGAAAGASPQLIGVAFTASALMALVGAVAATMAGARFGFRAPLSLGFAVQIFCAICMYIVADRTGFLAGVLLLNAVGAFTLPFVQAVLVDLDPSGRSASYSGAAINFGGALAPALCAGLTLAGGMIGIGIITCAIILVSLACVASALRAMPK